AQVSNNLVFHYNFNNNTIDQTGNSNPLTILGTGSSSFVTGIDGQSNSAIYLNLQHYKTINPLLPQGSADRTYAVWFKLHGQEHTYISCYGSNSNSNAFGIGV